MKEANINIGVFFGSRSPEHDISIITGQLVIAGLRALGYQVTPVYLSKKGEWLLGKALGTLTTFTDPQQHIDPRRFANYVLDLEQSLGKLVFRRRGFIRRTITVDLAFPAFHGANGEDGTIQGLLEIFDVPYVGCDVTSSALTMDKILTKQFYQAQNIPTTKFLYFDKRDWQADAPQIIAEIQAKLTWPVFVKPARLGSSIGIAKIKEAKDLRSAVEVALHFGERCLVEESVEQVMDVTCAVLGNADPRPSLLQESVFGDELFSYEDKYLKEGGAQLGKAQNRIIIPARLDAETTKQIQDLAVRIFKLFGCAGIARVDFLYDKKAKKCYANEVNTLPGTLYHHLWQKSGMELDALLTELLRLAQERAAARRALVSTFASDLLKQTHSAKLRLKKDV